MSYKILRIDASTARTDREHGITGDIISVLSAPGTANLELRLDSESASAQPLAEGDRLEGCFDRFFLSNDAVAGGEVVLFVGNGISLEHNGAALVGRYSEDPDDAADGALVPILTDAGGRPYVRLADRLEADLDSITVKDGGDALSFEGSAEITRPVPESVSETLASGANAGDTRLSLDLEGRVHCSLYCELGAAGEIKIEASPDNATWYEIDSETLGAAGAIALELATGWRYISILVPTAAVDITRAISAKT